MSRHLADHRAQSDGGRLKNFYRLEKAGDADSIHPASRELHRRAPSRDEVAKVRNYLRIERGLGA